MQGVKRGNMPLVKGQKVATNLLKGRKQSIIDPMKDLMLVMPQPSTSETRCRAQQVLCEAQKFPPATEGQRSDIH